MPQVDADGNERDGVRLPEITVPLATYASWNLRDPSIGAPDQRVAFEVSVHSVSEDRSRARASLAIRADRLPNAMRAAKIISTATRKLSTNLIKQRWILPEDRDALLHRGEQEWTEATK